jgi:translocator assembly and maintenance protein 41
MYLQKKPPCLFYHPFVEVSDSTQLFKYGVISRDSLIHDLTTWEYLYAAGRLHKPVCFFLNLIFINLMHIHNCSVPNFQLI